MTPQEIQAIMRVADALEHIAKALEPLEELVHLGSFDYIDLHALKIAEAIIESLGGVADSMKPNKE